MGSRGRSPSRHLPGALVAAIGGIVTYVILWLAAPGLVSGNFHTVLDGSVYRSGQLDAHDLQRVITDYGVRTVVNLRGAKPGRDWYDAEVELLRRAGVALHDIDLSSKLLPPQPAVLRLIDVIERAPAPLLLHCSAGADRAGFASAVARLLRADGGLAGAREEIGFAYGHMPVGPSTEIMRFFDVYERYLGRTGAPDRAATFKTWVGHEYVPYAYRARFEPVLVPARVEPATPMSLRVSVVNTSPEAWELAASRERGVKIGVRVRREHDKQWRDFDRLGHATGTIRPSERFVTDAVVVAPRERGVYWLKFDMVDEHVTWFEDQGSKPVEVRLEVR